MRKCSPFLTLDLSVSFHDDFYVPFGIKYVNGLKIGLWYVD